MALEATFTANFSEYSRALAEATSQTKAFEGEVKEAQGVASDLGNETGNTAKEMSGFGSTLLGFATTASGMFAALQASQLFGQIADAVGDFIELAGQMADLADKTGASTTALQGFASAAAGADVPISAIGNAIVNLSRKIAEGDSGAVSAIGKLGLSFTELRDAKPEDQFRAIADALGGMEDPGRKASAAWELFGVSAKTILPALTSDFGALSDEMQKAAISPEVIKSVDDLSDAWGRLKTSTGNLIAEGLAPLAPAMEAAADGEGAKAFVLFLDQITNTGVISYLNEFAEGITNLPKVIGPAADRMKDFWASFNKQVEGRGIDALAMDSATALQELNKQLDEERRQQEAAAKAAQAHAAELGKLAGDDIIAKARELSKNIEEIGGMASVSASKMPEISKAFTDATNEIIRDGGKVPAMWMDVAIQTQLASKELNTYKDGVPVIGQQIKIQIGDAWSYVSAQFAAEMPKVITGWNETLLQMGEQVDTTLNAPGHSLGDSLKAAFKGGTEGLGEELGASIMAAITGGGNVGEAIGGTLGKNLGTGFAGWAAGEAKDVIGGSLGNLLGGAANAVLPGVGALLGAGFGAIFDNIFKGEERKVNDLRDQLVSSAGGINELNQQAVAAGFSLDHLLDAKKTKDFQAAVEELKAKLQEHQQVLAALDTQLTQTFTHGGLLAADLVEQMHKLVLQDPEGSAPSIFKFLQEEIGQVSEGFNAAVGGWAQHLTNLKTLTDADAAQFQRFGTLASAAFNAVVDGGGSAAQALAAIRPGLQALADAAETFHLNTDAFGGLIELGNLADTFKPLLDTVGGLDKMMTGLANTGLLTSDSLSAIASTLSDAFKQMTAGGASADQAMRLMQPSLQHMWELEQQFGVQVDDATQSLINQAAQSGVVGDAFRSSGDKMVAAVQNMVNHLDALITALGGQLPQAAQQGVDGVNHALVTDMEYGISHAAQRTWDLRGVFTGVLPSGAQIGVDGINNALSNQLEYGIGHAAQRTWDLRNLMMTVLPEGASAGVDGINHAMDNVDVAGVQDAVHDIDWEFERGIPDAAASGVDIVNDHMDVAEDAIGYVDDAAEAVAQTVSQDIPNAANIAEGAINAFADSAVDDLGRIEEAGAGAAYGHSPTGIIQAAIAAKDAQRAIRDFADDATRQLGTVESAGFGFAGRGFSNLSLPKGGNQQTIIVEVDGQVLSEATVRNAPSFLRLKGKRLR